VHRSFPLIRRRIVVVAGARPNFMKVAPLWRALGRYTDEIEPIFVHTGQHYDAMMSLTFLRDLALPRPHFHLGVGSGSHAEQTGKVMIRFERVLEEVDPEVVLVVGDVNSTAACTLVCSKAGVPLGHVEAGLRSYDRSMPEEVNRLITDSLSDFLFTPSRDANENLIAEGIPSRKIFFVGNIMVDSLKWARPKARSSKIRDRLGITNRPYVLLTLHRPSNVDTMERLRSIWGAIEALGRERPVVFPVHPRTKHRLVSFGIKPDRGVILSEPLSYLDFLNLEENAVFVLTDSGGIQEETTYLGVPCLTLRENTERPITVTLGTNVLVGVNPDRILFWAKQATRGSWKKGKKPPYWDGRTAERIVEVLRRHSGNSQ